jgi:hypothetical protein
VFEVLLQQAFVSKAVKAFTADDDMIEQLDVEQLTAPDLRAAVKISRGSAMVPVMPPVDTW